MSNITDFETVNREYAEKFRDSGLIWYYWAIHMEEVFSFKHNTEKFEKIISKAHPDERNTMLAMFSEMTVFVVDREIFVSDAQPKANPDLDTQVASIMFEALRECRELAPDDLDNVVPAEELGQLLQEYDELLTWVKKNWATSETEGLHFCLDSFGDKNVNTILQFFAFTIMLPVETVNVLRQANMEKILLPDMPDDWDQDTVANAVAWENLLKLYTPIAESYETSSAVKLLKLFAVAHDKEIPNHIILGRRLSGYQFERLVQYGERYTGVFAEALRTAQENEPESLRTALPQDWLYQVVEYGCVEGGQVWVDPSLWYWVTTEAAKDEGGKLKELGRQ